MRATTLLILVSLGAWACLVPASDHRRTRAAAADAPAPATQPAGPAEPAVAWGDASDGLRLGIAVDPPTADGRHPLTVVFRNDGPADILLNMGVMLGNGAKQFPTAVRLRLARGDGPADDLEAGPAGVAGRMDDMPVPLPAGATYRLRVVLENYSNAAGPAHLAPGENRLTARFEGAGPQTDNTGMEGMRTMKFWHGRLASGPLPVSGAAR